MPTRIETDLLLIRVGQRLFGQTGSALVQLRDGRVLECHLDEDWQLLVFVTGSYNSPVTRVFEHVLRPGDGILDVGANFGWYSTLAARLVGSRGHVWALEPLPETVTALTRNLELNGQMGTVTVLQEALSDHDGSASFYSFDELTSVRASLSDQDRADARAIEVPIRRLPGLLTELGRPIDVIKCDAEGEEGPILSDSAAVLASPDHPLWFVELSDYLLRERGYDSVDVQEMMRAAGYRALLITAGGCVPLAQPASVDGDVLFYDPDLHADRVRGLPRVTRADVVRRKAWTGTRRLAGSVSGAIRRGSAN